MKLGEQKSRKKPQAYYRMSRLMTQNFASQAIEKLQEVVGGAILLESTARRSGKILRLLLRIPFINAIAVP